MPFTTSHSISNGSWMTYERRYNVTMIVVYLTTAVMLFSAIMKLLGRHIMILQMFLAGQRLVA
jgi:hypothetical protein